MSLADNYSVRRLSVARMSSGRTDTDGPLATMLGDYRGGTKGPHWHSDWAWENYEPLTLALAKHFGLRRLLEVGGGRDPGFLDIGRKAGLDVIVNDIDAGELALLPQGTPTAQFDVAGDLRGRPDLIEAFDLMTARMVFEHIHDVETAWKNIHRMLTPGGIGMAFFPTLYSWPFLVNKLLPPETAKKIVHRFFPNRADDGDNPVFPAHYDWCYGSEAKLRRMLDPIGYSEVAVLPFWGHRYLDRVPVARELDHLANRTCAALDIRTFTTYAIVILRK
jgi:SAM-dependent methyltransferase